MRFLMLSIVRRSILVGKGRIAGYDEQLRNLGELGDDAFGDGVA